ncbi:MAG: phosphoglucosamine mutase [Deltaproteobacteria bacterium]|nr:phosphoglucosamine mutase [Deltaproteobacteria bacterium]
MKRERKYFGTDGIRGVASVPPLDPETLVRLGKGIAKIFLRSKGKHRVLIGKDTRLSGYMIETSLAAGVTSMGADVWLVGPVPTPGIAYLTKSMRADAGIMISASHNAFEDNGIKIFGSDGYKLPDELELELEDLMEPGVLDGKSAEPGSIGKAARIDDAIGRYCVYLKSCFPREFSLEGMKIGFDCANGAAYVVGPQTCSELGADVVSRGVSPNGRNINAGFGSLYPEIVRKLVLEQNLDIGISLDGDGDRAILVDEEGNTLDGDMILAICALDLKQRGLLRSDTVVATVMSNLGLDRLLSKHGINVLRAPVGDRYVLEAMMRGNAALGGEQSGHTIFTDYSTTGDGILTALMILNIMFRTKKSLSELNQEFVKFPQKLININVSHKPPLESVEPIRKLIEQKVEELKDSGRILVRYSGTENKARVMVECEDEDLCRKHAQDVAELIERELGVV